MEKQNENLLKTAYHNVVNSLPLKLFMMGILILVLLLPKYWIQELIEERSGKYDEVEEVVAEVYGGKQTILGPILVIPYQKTQTDGKKTWKSEHKAYFLPETLLANGKMTKDERGRSIYKVPVYLTKMTMSGSFIKPNFKSIQPDSSLVFWKKAKIIWQCSDVARVKQMKLSWEGAALPVAYELRSESYLNNTLVSSVPMDKKKHYEFNIAFDIKGSQSFAVIPSGNSTKLTLTSDWPHPKFVGKYAPKHTIGESGFTAEWEVQHFNRSFPKQWTHQNPDFFNDILKVDIYEPLNEYKLNLKSVKYAIMTIILTFTLYFFLELFTKKRFHLIQYLLTGCALLLFYVLLLSLSEHISFNLSYAIASFLNISLISFYSFGFILQFKYRAFFIAVLIGLYAYIFAMLNAQEFGLLVGSFGLFFMLAIVMQVSRKMNWQISR